LFGQLNNISKIISVVIIMIQFPDDKKGDRSRNIRLITDEHPDETANQRKVFLIPLAM
jgi:hypothetical protein